MENILEHGLRRSRLRMAKMSNHKSEIINQKSPASWHHRMARLIADAYSPKCQAPGCKPAALYVCEWDQIRGIRAVSGCKLYCADHAANFAQKHGIYMADSTLRSNSLRSTSLPDVKLSQLETASRDDWKYGDGSHEGTKALKQIDIDSSCLSDFVAGTQSEER